MSNFHAFQPVYSQTQNRCELLNLNVSYNFRFWHGISLYRSSDIQPNSSRTIEQINASERLNWLNKKNVSKFGYHNHTFVGLKKVVSIFNRIIVWNFWMELTPSGQCHILWCECVTIKRNDLIKFFCIENGHFCSIAIDLNEHFFSASICHLCVIVIGGM